MSARVKVALLFLFLAWAIAASESLPLWTLIPAVLLAVQGTWMVWVESREQVGKR